MGENITKLSAEESIKLEEYSTQLLSFLPNLSTDEREILFKLLVELSYKDQITDFDNEVEASTSIQAISDLLESFRSSPETARESIQYILTNLQGEFTQAVQRTCESCKFMPPKTIEIDEETGEKEGICKRSSRPGDKLGKKVQEPCTTPALRGIRKRGVKLIRHLDRIKKQ